MDQYLQQKIDDLKQKKLFRAPKGEWNEGFINFTSNDYLAMAKRAEVIAAGVEAAEKYGAGATASRIAGGNFPLYEELEKVLAKMKNAEASCVFGSGYLANIGVVPALVEKGDLIIADKLVHACIIDAAKLSGAELVRFKHNDTSHLKELLEKRSDYRNCLIISEEIFSMDGDLAPLAKLRQLAERFDAWLMVDGAHSLYQTLDTKLQTLDKNPNLQSLKSNVYVGTLSKAVGIYGGYVAGSKTLIEYIKSKARSLIYSTGLPPFAVGAAVKSLTIIGEEKPYIQALQNANYFREQMGLQKTDSTIIPIFLRDEEKALEIENYLKGLKLLVSAIRPPTVPPKTTRLRVSITAAHKKSEIDLLVNSLKNIL